MVRSLFVTIAAGMMLLGVCPIADAARAPAPPSNALFGHDAAGETVAVWVDSAGALITSHRSIGAWSHHFTLYTPSRICWYHGARCVEDHVSPVGLVVNADGNGFFALRQEIKNDHGAHCEIVVAGRVSTVHDGGELGSIGISRGDCQSHLNYGNVPSIATAIAPDGTAALAYVIATNNPRDPDTLIFNTVHGVTQTPAVEIHPDHADGPDIGGLQVGIDGSDDATVVWRSAERPARLYYCDIVDGEVGDGLVSPRGGVGNPMLFVDPAGPQTVTYDGAALVGQRWVRGRVTQMRPAAGQPWSAPVLVS